MSNNEEYNPMLPREFAALEPGLLQAKIEISDIDAMIEQLDKDSGPSPGFRPPGYHGENKSGRQGMFQQLEDRKAAIRRNFDQQLEPALNNADPKTAKNVRESVATHLSGSVYSQMDKTDLADSKPMAKPLDKSQEFMGMSLSNYRATLAPKTEAVVAGPQVDKAVPRGERFLNSLNYKKELGKAETLKDAPEKGLADKVPSADKKSGIEPSELSVASPEDIDPGFE